MTNSEQAARNEFDPKRLTAAERLAALKAAEAAIKDGTRVDLDGVGPDVVGVEGVHYLKGLLRGRSIPEHVIFGGAPQISEVLVSPPQTEPYDEVSEQVPADSFLGRLEEASKRSPLLAAALANRAVYHSAAATPTTVDTVVSTVQG